MNDDLHNSMIEKASLLSFKYVGIVMIWAGMLYFGAQPLVAQSTESEAVQNQLKSLRSDVGIIGLTANIRSLNSFDRVNTDSTTTPLQKDGSSELEFVLRDVRMISQRVGVGFQVLTSFFTNDAEGEPSFGIGSWGLGPSLRAYPLKNANRLQPYIQANALFGNNLAVGKLANTTSQGGFRVRLGLRAGASLRINNNLGFFVEYGPDWGSPRIFKADSRVLQLNFGIDVFRFN